MIKSQVYIARRGDNEIAQAEMQRLSDFSMAQLVERYNDVARKGFFGSHAQGLHVAALHHTMKKVFGKSPITIGGGGHLIELEGGEIVLVGDQWEYFFS
ncbi:MAG: hypothetical protein ACOYOA_15595 [Saprospiraceae bacterium]